MRLLIGRYLQNLLSLGETPLLDGTEVLQTATGQVTATFTHAPLTWQDQTADDLSVSNSIQMFSANSVALLVRYPLDVLVSSYMQLRFQVPETHRFAGSIEEFVKHPVFGIDKLLRFHQIWDGPEAKRLSPTVLRYEDLIVDPTRCRTLIGLLGFPFEDSILHEAANYTSFSKMKAMQAGNAVPRYKSSGLPIFGPVNVEEPRSHHVRRGGSGHYRSELPPALSAALEERISREMPSAFGYDEPPAPKDAA